MATELSSRQRRRAQRTYIGLIASSFVSNTGNAFSNLAIPLYVLATTGSASKTGVIAVANYAPPILASVFGGALVDRIGRRRTLIVSDALSFISTAAIPLLHLANALTFPTLIALVAIGALLDAPGRTARGSMLPMAANRAGIPPERAQSLNQSGYFIAQTVGPALAGLIIAANGPTAALWVNAVSFVISILIVTVLVETPQMMTPSAPTTYMDDLREGYRFVFHDHFLRSMVLFVTGFTMFFAPLYSVVYPVFFTNVIQSEATFGFFIGMEAAGAFLGGVAYGIWGHRFSRWKVFMWSMIVWIPTFWPILIPPGTWLLLLCGFLGGLTTGPINPIFHVAFQVRTPEVMRARTNSIVSAGAAIGIAIGALTMGPAVEQFGSRWVLAFVALVYSVAPFMVLLMPVFKEIDRDLEPQAVAT